VAKLRFHSAAGSGAARYCPKDRQRLLNAAARAAIFSADFWDEEDSRDENEIGEHAKKEKLASRNLIAAVSSLQTKCSESQIAPR